jgi:glycosyltransferase A (GT-A) superfamily protein (DUF2064 family)
LFARSPRAEAIAKGIGAAEALFELAVRRAVLAARELGVDLIVAGDLDSVPNDAIVLRQRGGSFAERLQAAFGDARRLGYSRIVAVGNDTPALRSRHLQRAFALLDRCSLVLGPSDDGGVYLIGARAGLEERFGAVRWTSRSTCSDLSSLAPALLLERLTDVDGERDLLRLRAERDRELSRTLARIRRPLPLSFERPARRQERVAAVPAIRGPPA